MASKKQLINPGDHVGAVTRVFSSWWVVGKYMLQTSLLCLTRVGWREVRSPDLRESN